MSTLEDRLLVQIIAAGLPRPEREGRLVPGRRFACDFYWATDGIRLVCEVEGGTFGRRSRHSTGTGYARDCEKYNLLQLLGWLVLRVTDAHIRNGDALHWIADALALRGAVALTEVKE